ncbi:MAG: hypothetical protein ABEH77_02690 [Halobacteriaceae archaeon]
MHADDEPAMQPDRSSRIATLTATLRTATLTTLVVTIVAVDPVLAQSSGSAFCETAMAETVKNLFSLIQFGGPLVGGVVALGATVVTPTVRRSDMKRELKEARNQAILWGVLVAPLGTAIVQFLLTNVVAGGASCAF